MSAATRPAPVTETFSATALINRHLDVYPPEVKAFRKWFVQRHTARDVLQYIQAFRDLRVLAVGESIVDEYVFCEALAKANKDPILSVRPLRTERYAGGILAIANHLAGFCAEVGLVSELGAENPQSGLIAANLAANVRPHFTERRGAPTIVKRRFVEHATGQKLLEVNILNNDPTGKESEAALCAQLEALLPQFDAVVVADYGHGLLTGKAIELLCEKARFLTVSTQINAANRGFNLISRYPRADFIVLDEAEARAELCDPVADLRGAMPVLASRTHCGRLLVTLGREGALCYDASDAAACAIPAFASGIVDRIGAGDAVLAVSAMAAAVRAPMEVVGFVGNVAGAEACGIMGNQRAVDPDTCLRHITSLLT